MNTLWLLLVLFFPLGLQAQLPVGNVSSIANVACPTGFINGTVCQHMVVSGCPNTVDIGITVGTKTPARPIGTVVFFIGANGTRPYGGSFVGDYYKKGYRVVDLQWDTPGWFIPGTGQPRNLLNTSCRGASMVNYLAGLYSGQGSPFCAQGKSAGSAQLAYAMSWYGMAAKLDNVELLSGPVMSDLAQGCEVPSAPVTTVVPTNGEPFLDAPQYVTTFINPITQATGQQCLPPTNTTPQQDLNWLAQSIIQPATASLDFPHTPVSGWLCDNGQNNSAAQGQIFYQAITSSHSLTRISGCTGSEGVEVGTTPQGVMGQLAIEQDMQLQCVVRH